MRNLICIGLLALVAGFASAQARTAVETGKLSIGTADSVSFSSTIFAESVEGQSRGVVVNYQLTSPVAGIRGVQKTDGTIRMSLSMVTEVLQAIDKMLGMEKLPRTMVVDGETLNVSRSHSILLSDLPPRGGPSFGYYDGNFSLNFSFGEQVVLTKTQVESLRSALAKAEKIALKLS